MNSTCSDKLPSRLLVVNAQVTSLSESMMYEQAESSFRKFRLMGYSPVRGFNQATIATAVNEYHDVISWGQYYEEAELLDFLFACVNYLGDSYEQYADVLGI